MTPVSRIHGRAYPLGLKNVDTDMIIAAEHLKTISRIGLGRFAFAALRKSGGSAFDDPACVGAPILLAGDNFGCGSSREHAVWALQDMGVEAVIATGFSDIFSSNAFKNGMVAVELDQAAIDRLLEAARHGPITIDLEEMTVSALNSICFHFEMDPFRRQCLLQGHDEVALSLLNEPAIRAYELRSGSLAPVPLAS